MKGPRKPRPPIAVGMKWCPRGAGDGHIAPIADFAKNARFKDGLANVCRACQAAYRKAKYVPRPRLKPPRRTQPAFSPNAVHHRAPPPSCYLFLPRVCAGPLSVGRADKLLCAEHNRRFAQVLSGDVPGRTRAA